MTRPTSRPAETSRDDPLRPGQPDPSGKDSEPAVDEPPGETVPATEDRATEDGTTKDRAVFAPDEFEPL